MTAGSEAAERLAALADEEVAQGHEARALMAMDKELLDRVLATGPKPETDIEDAVDVSKLYAPLEGLERGAGDADGAAGTERPPDPPVQPGIESCSATRSSAVSSPFCRIKSPVALCVRFPFFSCRGTIHMKRTATILAVVLLAGLATVTLTTADEPGLSDRLTFSDDSGVQRTIGMAKGDDDTAFFQDLGTNGCSCFTCHQPDQAWTVTPERIRERFERTQGLDPIFRTNDGSNCEGADVSSTKKRRRAAYSQLLTRGLIRTACKCPPALNSRLRTSMIRTARGAPLTEASMYRRPLPSTNLGFLSTVMWDGRETVKGQSIRADLETQANDATTGHAQGSAAPRRR